MRFHKSASIRLMAGLSICGMSLLANFGLGTPRAHADAPTVVSLVFDDSNLDQYTNAFPVMQAHQMHGTFYTITGYINNLTGFMTLSQLQSLYNAGNEIAGHTVLHPYLGQISTDEATREICDSRNTLLNWGFPATDFAYPHSDLSPTIEGIAQQCGYNSARSDGQITSPDGCISGCPMAETIPPADPYLVKAPDSIEDIPPWSVASIENIVTQTENSGGGWTMLVFHHICDNACDLYSITPADFTAVLDWLQTQNVTIKTVSQVIGGPVNPPVSAPEVSPAPAGVNGVANPSFETMDPYQSGTPDCWTTNTKGTNNASFSETSDAHSGQVAEQVNISSFTSGAARLIVRQDLGQCAPAVVPGDKYLMSAWYKSDTPTRFGLWYRDSVGGWHSWTQSPQFAASSTWTQAVWATPPIPSYAVAVSFGLDIEAAGTLTVDDLGLVDAGGPPTVSLTSPVSGSTVSGVALLSANTSSAIGIARVDYLVNGALVASSTTAPFSTTWNSASVADGPVTFTALATDTAGNQTTSTGVTATISNGVAAGPVASGVQGYWKFDENSGTSAGDATGHGFTGATHGSNIWTPSGQINAGLHLDGTSNYVSTSFPVPTSGPVTYAGWANRADTSGSYGLLGSSNTSGNGPLIQVPSGTGNIKFWRHTSGSSITFAGVLPPPGTWFQWALADNPTAQTTTLYINGVAKGTISNTATGSTAGTLEVGGYSGSSSLFKGSIDEVGVWNRALSAADESALWNGGVGLQYPFPVTLGPPTVSITSPVSGGLVGGTAAPLSVNASSGIGLARVDYFVNGAWVASSTTAPYSTTWNSSTVANGSVTFTAVATDTAGTQTTSTGVVASISNAAPTVSITSPASGAVVGGSAVPLTVNATSGIGIARIDYFVNTTLVASSTTAPFSTTWNSVSVADGPATFTAIATDTGGNQTTSAGVMATVSNAPPTVSITSPASGAVVGGIAAPISANVSSALGIARVDYFVNSTLVASSSTAPFSTTWNSTSVANGSATFTARATDTGGNQTTSVGVVATISNGSLTIGLQGYWKFDDNSGTSASDATGHGFTGTTHGSNIWTPSGEINAGLHFDGTSNYVSTSYPVPTSGQVTYAGWADPADSSKSYGILGSSSSSGTGPLIQIPSGTSNIKFWRQTAGVSTTFTAVLPPPGTWFEWALVDDPAAQTTTLYVNGVAKGTNHYTAPDSAGGNLEAGGYSGSSSLFKGLMDEVGVWNRALSATEITSLWNGGAGRQYPFS